MDAMSIMHDKWTDKNVGLFNGKLSDTPYLQISIIPAIPITYLGLIGETMNVFDIKTNLLEKRFLRYQFVEPKI